MADVKLEQGAYGGPGIAAARLDRCIAASSSAASSAGCCSAGADISMIPGLTGEQFRSRYVLKSTSDVRNIRLARLSSRFGPYFSISEQSVYGWPTVVCRVAVSERRSRRKPRRWRGSFDASPLRRRDPTDDAWWDAVLSDPRAGAVDRSTWIPIQSRRLSEIQRDVLRVECLRCFRAVEIQRADAVKLYGPHAVWKDVGARLLADGCQHRTGRHEEDGCWPEFR